MSYVYDSQLIDGSINRKYHLKLIWFLDVCLDKTVYFKSLALGMSDGHFHYFLKCYRLND